MNPVPTRYQEYALEAQLDAFFRNQVREKLGGLVLKMAPTMVGVPDRLVIAYQNLYLVELKTETGKLSPVQKSWHYRVNQLGVEVYTLRGRGQIIGWIRQRALEIDGTKRRELSRSRLTMCCSGCDGEDCRTCPKPTPKKED